MDYVRYYFPVLLQVRAILGVAAGGAWVWLSLAQLPTLALVDGFLEYDGRVRKASSEKLMDLPPASPADVGYAIRDACQARARGESPRRLATVATAARAIAPRRMTLSSCRCGP